MRKAITVPDGAHKISLNNACFHLKHLLNCASKQTVDHFCSY